jgi:2-polyprenyl-3-methyl-5-hydroxy-6-metoxy-1,4-benzoquinol methylase
VLRNGRHLARATELLLERTAADRPVWHHFAIAAGITDPASLAADAVERRLSQWCTTSFFARFEAQSPANDTVAVSDLAAALDGAVPNDARLLTVLLDEPHHLSLRSRHVTAVLPTGSHFPAAHEVIELAHPDVVDLRDTLTGRDFDEMLVGSAWRDLAAPAALFAQLAHTAAPHTRLLVVADASSSARAERLARNSGWHDLTHLPLLDGVLLVGRLGEPDVGAPATHYGLSFEPGNPDDSRSIVFDMLQTAPTVLELGCSEGLTTRLLTERGQRVVGVEIDPDAAEVARPFAEQVLVADLDATDALDPLGDRTFHAVAVADVLEHLREPASALRRAMRHLAPHGDLVLSVPNLAHADVRLALLDGRVPYADLGLLDRTHVHWFTHEGLLRLLADCGLCVVEWRSVVRAPGSTEVPLDEAQRQLAHQWFADDPHATTYQWVLRCRRIGEGTPVPEPAAAAPQRRFMQATTLGIKASARSLRTALLRRLR